MGCEELRGVLGELSFRSAEPRPTVSLGGRRGEEGRDAACVPGPGPSSEVEAVGPLNAGCRSPPKFVISDSAVQVVRHAIVTSHKSTC